MRAITAKKVKYNKAKEGTISGPYTLKGGKYF